MATCDRCGTTILFGGVKDGDYRFCNNTCRNGADVLLRAAAVPDEEVLAEAMRIRESNCPDCQGEGPIDLHTHHWVWSALAFTRWGSQPRLSCRGCARKRQLGHAAKSFVLGWWGFPWGILLTPVQVVRNFAGATRWDDGQPSPALMKLARAQAGARMQSAPMDANLV